MGKNSQQQSNSKSQITPIMTRSAAADLDKNQQRILKSSTSSGSSKNQHDPKGSRSSLTNGRSSSIGSDDRFELSERRLTCNLTKVIKDRFDELLIDVSRRMDELLVHFNTEIAKICENFVDLQQEVNGLRDEIEDLRRAQRLSDAIITGVPHKADAPPAKVLDNISRAIGHTISPYTTAFRTNVKPRSGRVNGMSKEVPIVVKFSSMREQREFLHKFRAAGQIKLNQINCGFQSDSRISAFEGLTRRNQGIFRAAAKLRKQNLVQSVYTREGIVYVRRTLDDSPQKITSANALSLLIPEATIMDVRD